MRKALVIIMAVLLLQACSGMSMLKKMNPFTEDKGIDATVQIGKNNTKIENKALADVKVDSTINNSTDTTNNIQSEVVEMVSNYKDSPWLIILLALALPGPWDFIRNRRNRKKINELRNEVKELIKERYSRPVLPQKAPGPE